MWGINLTGHGRYDEAIAVFEEGLALAEKLGDENYTPRYLNSLGRLYLECGDLGRAEDLNRRAADGARKRRDDESIANADLHMADIVLARGDRVLAREMLDEVHRRLNDPGTSECGRWRYSMHLFASLGEAALAAGDLDGARRFADACLERALRSRSRKYANRAWRLRAEAAGHDHTSAEQAMYAALRAAESMGSPAALWRTHAAAGHLEAARGNRDAAHAGYAGGPRRPPAPGGHGARLPAARRPGRRSGDQAGDRSRRPALTRRRPRLTGRPAAMRRPLLPAARRVHGATTFV